jgi:hypothetical protein
MCNAVALHFDRHIARLGRNALALLHTWLLCVLASRTA